MFGTAVLLLGLLQSGPAEAEPREPVDDAAAVDDHRDWTVGARYVLWLADLDLEVATGSTIDRIDTESHSGADLFLRADAGDRVAVEAGVEFTTGGASDSESILAGARVVYRLPLPEDRDLAASVKAGVVYGVYDIDGVAGEFDPAAGFEAGLEGRWDVEAAFGVTLSARLRVLEFGFDADPGSTASEDEIGGTGFVLLAGLEARF